MPTSKKPLELTDLELVWVTEPILTEPGLAHQIIDALSPLVAVEDVDVAALGTELSLPSSGLISDFAAHLTNGQDPSPALVTDLFALALLIEFATTKDFDLGIAGNVVSFIDAVAGLGKPPLTIGAHRLLGEYAAFRAATGAETDLWEDVTVLLQDRLTDISLDADSARDRLPIISGVTTLLDWLRVPRPITPGLGLRLADIQPVAAMLGISASGVENNPGRGLVHEPLFSLEESEPDRPAIQARSISDVPLLLHWWKTLEALDLIDLDDGEASAGAQAARFLATIPPPHDLVEDIIIRFIVEVLTPSVRLTRTHLVRAARALVARRLRQLISGIDQEMVAASVDFGEEAMPMAKEMLELIEGAGTIKRRGDSVSIPGSLHGLVEKSILLAPQLENTQLYGD